jgi:UDP-glucose 4-epimerase
MFGLDAFIIRPFNNYGPRQNSSGLLAGIIPITICRILRGIPPEIHGDGLQSRDFIHARDTVDATLKLYGVMPAGESVNVSTDNQISVRDLIAMISREMGYEGEVLSKPARGSDVFCHNASNAKLRSLIDFRLIPFEEGLRETIASYREERGG